MNVFCNTIQFFKQYVLITLLVFSCTLVVNANVEVHALFSDGMVIQRDTEIPIWGWADANEIVTIESSWGASAQVITATDGTWRANLKTPEAGGPHKITVFSKNKIEINDVLSGDVWLCTGQSNMDFAMNKFVGDAREPQYQPLVEYIRNEVATANDDWIRHIEVPRAISLYKKKTNFKASWRRANPEEIGDITAAGYFFAKALRKQVNVPIGLLECAWGGTRVQPWISEETYLADKNMKDYFEASRAQSENKIAIMEADDYVDTDYNNKMKVWEDNGKKGKAPKPTQNPKDDMQLPATLYNGMISSIVPFAIKGAIWYQGESNAVYMPNQYEYYLTKMIKNWRDAWNQGEFPFYYAQLAACQRPNDKADKGWASVNNQLRKTLKVPNTGMAVLYDIGEAKDIHPHNKMDAGTRLALWALQNEYQVNVAAVSGPLYKSHTVNGKKIEVEFSEVAQGLMVGYKDLLEPTKAVKEALKWFEIKGENGAWKPAKAKIKSKSTIEVWGKGIKRPTAVRYAWSGNPEGANLYNKSGLPAAVFSTEE
ncbi:sialate O-acetylesterase [Formosa sediminum]|uniref:Sialate O-acetylesterase n=1 Tax=Formosa sediminum TaxID=2594004 RepID=A0A516GRZ5_9FLAO|nr:sialate O-acetylesterase [Formosa sediminum]QDO94289.1 sialate O-acetylesterase [Formosa sediminum]